MADQESKPLDYAAAVQPPARPPQAVPDEETRGFCGWAIFAPHTQTWLGFVLAWICVVAIILLTAVLAKIGS